MSVESIQRLQEMALKAQNKVSQRSLASKMRISQSTLSEWSNGNVKEWPTNGRLEELAKVLGCTLGQLIDYLHTGKEIPELGIDEIIGKISLNKITPEEALRLHQAIANAALSG